MIICSVAIAAQKYPREKNFVRDVATKLVNLNKLCKQQKEFKPDLKITGMRQAEGGRRAGSIRKRMRDNLPLTPEQTAFHADWKAQKNEQRREYYHTKKAEMAVAVGQ